MTDARLAAAMAHHRSGRLDEANGLYEQVLAANPDEAEALHLSALIALQRGEHDRAQARLGRAAALKPDDAVLLNDFGVALRLGGRARDAAAAFARSGALKSDYAEAWHNLGLTHRALGELPQAAEALRRAAALRPNSVPTHSALGIVLAALGDIAGACATFRRAVELAPDSPETHNNLGLALHHAGEGEAARAALERALAIKPDFADAVFNLGVVRQKAGDFAGAQECWQRTVAIDPRHAIGRVNLLFSLQYDPAATGESLLAVARDWDALHGHPADAFRDWPNARDPQRRLKIGYVSPDLRDHSCAYFLRPLFTAHDRGAVEVFVYAEVARPDAMSIVLRGLVDHWRATQHRPAPAVAEEIRADGIDVLVDLAGHSSGNRLDVFALKPAPLQGTWLGYAGTTGLSALDFRLTDARADPPGAEAQASERLIRLPRGFHCWQPPSWVSEPAPPPAMSAGHITFGSFNNVQKLSAPTIALWAEILRQVPDAHLVLKSNWLSRPAVADRLHAAFAAHGVARERVQMLAWIGEPHAHMAAYHRIDIALDTFPYNGTTTTLEALWMGVPVVTLAGIHHAARVGISLLGQLGLDELIAATPAAYADIATGLAGDADRRADYRAALRRRLAASPLMDARGFARDVEAAYRALWREWCARNGGD
ncbi:MAG: tetratricopeptide repeat protein [Proteobacteria bacterium]|nr:tetratricopeptide repeat protein [Pseudomonadota bacterium]